MFPISKKKKKSKAVIKRIIVRYPGFPQNNLCLNQVAGGGF